MKKKIDNLLFVIWIVALISTVGSLFLSEIMRLEPCKLCWYQRICMYPLVLIGMVSIIKKDYKQIDYILPISIIGLFIAIYHSLIQYLPHGNSVTCGRVPCTLKYIDLFGFITIPLLSFISFLIIVIACLIIKKDGVVNK